MNKSNCFILPILLICIVFASCSNSDIFAINIENGELSYNGKTYVSTNSTGENLNSSWIIDDTYETEKVKGIININGMNSKITVKKFKDEKFNMFLFDDDHLYCEKNYDLPDYREESSVKKIIIIPNSNTFPNSSNSIEIKNQKDIKLIISSLIDASNIENYANNKSIEKVKSSDSDIIIVYSNFPLKYYYGYISIDQEDNYGIYCANTNFENYIYPIDNEMLTIIDKYGEWY